jgi:8-oxo-dGTP diphosphatase
VDDGAVMTTNSETAMLGSDRPIAHEAPIVAAFMLLRSPEGRVLLLRRAAGEDHAGEWSLPGGKLKPGETPEQAVVREVLEELGWNPGSPGQWHCRRVANNVDATTFIKNVQAEFTPPSLREHDAWQWVAPDDALAMNGS